MQTFDCPKCGAPVTYDPILTKVARCSYCESQLAVPNPYASQPPPVFRPVAINISPQVASGAKKIASVVMIIPILIIVFVFVIILAVFGMVNSTIKSVTAPLRNPGLLKPSAANSFANAVLEFGQEGIGPGMMTDARSIAVDGRGNIYVGEYSGGRIQVFDASGNFLRQWTADPKM